MYNHVDRCFISIEASELRDSSDIPICTGDTIYFKINFTVEPLLYDHPQNHIGVVV